MASGDHSTSTLREKVPTRGGRDDVPVLLVGSFVPEASRVVSLDGPVTIGRGHKSAGGGRAPDAPAGTRDVVVILHSDGTLSRSHLRIAGSQGAWQVEDLGSANGTFVDGRQVQRGEPVRLAEGSIVQFGCCAGVFRRVSEDELEAIEAEAANPLGPLATRSPSLAVTAVALRRLAPTRTDMLFLGETGSGKEVYARAVHAASRRTGEFVALNCAALPPDLIESELFGYARGAHSTATRAKPGLVETADGGTLLLDEIGDMPPRAQVKLLRFLQDRQVLALGSTRPRLVDVRVIAATSQAADSLRGDLVGRLGAEPIVIPPLRDRAEDIGALVAHFGGGAVAGMEPTAFRALCLYDWPHNVRELDEVIKRAVALAGGRPIRTADLPASVRATLERGPRAAAPLRKWRQAPPRAELERLLRENRGNVSAVAKTLNRQWNVVQRWLQHHDLDPEQFRR